MACRFRAEIIIGGKFSNGPLISYLDGEIISGGWIDCGDMRLIDIEARVKQLGYGSVVKIGYIEPRYAMRWTYITLVKSDEEVRKMWEEAIEFGSVKLFIETNEYAGIDELEEVPINNALNDYLSVSQRVEDYDPNEEINSENGDSDENASHKDDEEYVFAKKNAHMFRNASVDNGQGLGLDYLIEANIDQCIDDQGLAQMEIDLKNQVHNDGVVVSEYEDSCEEGYETPYSSDENDLEINTTRRKEKHMVYNPKCNHERIEWVVNMIFKNAAQFKEAVKTWSICCGYDIRWSRSSQTRMEARCVNHCKWRLYAAKKQHENTFTIRRIVNEHNCHRMDKNKQANSSWLAKQFLSTFRRKPSYGIDEMQVDMKEKYGLKVSEWVCYKARNAALKILRGSLEEHYAKLHSYRAELYKVDKHGTFEFENGDLGPNGNPTFKRFYIGFSSLRNGYLEGCRPVLCLDGCFLKTLLGGALLSAVAKDGNNQMYPISWAVVEGENEHTWRWYLIKLFEDINVSTGLGLTLISDKQKGLVKAVAELVPHAEHRNCAKHIHANWKKKYSGQEYKILFWKMANATYEAEYNKFKSELKELNQDAHDDFVKQEPVHFCKSFVSIFPKCDDITSNLAETFNGYICKARTMHVIHMLEEIRTCLMERICKKYEMMGQCEDAICPRIRKKIENNKYASRYCNVKPASSHKFQVSIGEERYVVSLEENTCTCRAWQLSGIPCSHAIASIYFKRQSVEDYVDSCYSKSTYFKVYKHFLEPSNGPKMWPNNISLPSLLPPPYKKMPGRPPKNRKRAPQEEPKSRSMARRFGIHMTCQHCLNTGHNRRGCPMKDQPAAPRPPNGKRGRPRTNQSVATIATSRPSNNRAHSEMPPTSSVTSADKHMKKKIVQEKRKVSQGFGVRMFSDTGNIYARMPGDKRVKYVSGPKATAKAARNIQVAQMQQKNSIDSKATGID